MHCFAMGIGKDLNFNMPAIADQPLKHQLAVTKSAERFTPCTGQRGGQVGQVVHQPHAAATTAGHGFDEQRQT